MKIKYLVICSTLCLFLPSCSPAGKELPPPNILWITCEDISLNLGCYGDQFADTPNLDSFAEEGVVYTNAFASAPVCAVARSGIITGLYASSLGSQHMRCKAKLPEQIKTYPDYLREAGYFCTNNSKTDYNLDFEHKSVWDECDGNAHWRNRREATQPFFAIFNLGTTHESRVNDAERHAQAITDVPPERLKKPGEVPVPPYFPDTEIVRELWTRYYNNITAMDLQIGELLEQLEADGLDENTIVFFYSDHGAGVPRYKRWLYDTGLHVPLVVRVPEKYRGLLPYQPGSRTDELVSFIDFPATAVHLTGHQIPEEMEGRAFLGENLAEPRQYIFAGRDRMDERYDMQRAVRSKRYKYIRYYEPYQPYCQYMNTPEKGAIMQAIRKAEAEGTVPEAGEHIVQLTKPEEELFDTRADPLELRNLAADPTYAEVLEEMREVHDRWSDDTKDTGLIPETILRHWEEQYQMPIYEIMRRKAVPVAAIRETALGRRTNDELWQDLLHENAAVRYWSAIHLGNRDAELRGFGSLTSALRDRVPLVSIAAARALCKLGSPQQALPILERWLADSDQWVRLAAAQILDEIAGQAQPLIPAMRAAMEDENKYVVRVLNRALNQLEGTSNIVR